MAFRIKYESAKPLYIYLLQHITPWSKQKAKPRKIYMETDPQFAPKLVCIQDIFHTNSSTAINNNEDNNRFILPSFRINIGRALFAYQGIKLEQRNPWDY